MTYNFISFENKRKNLDCYICSGKGSGSIIFKKKFVDKIKDKNFKYVNLFYDENNKTLAFKFLESKERNSFLLSGKQYALNSVRFFRVNNLLNIKDSFKIEEYQDEKLGMLYLVKFC
jgi:hypothetical protein